MLCNSSDELSSLSSQQLQLFANLSDIINISNNNSSISNDITNLNLTTVAQLFCNISHQQTFINTTFGTPFNPIVNISSQSTNDPPYNANRLDSSKFELRYSLPGAPGSAYAICVLCASVAAFAWSSAVLLGTRYAAGGRGVTLVFLKSMCVSDLLVSMYALGKMSLLLHLGELPVNFFLPDSLFFTASFASSLSLLCLNMDCFFKLTRPLKYNTQVDNELVLTIMVLVWNAAFVVGFLPLVGWCVDDLTVRFFRYYTWHYLLLHALVVFLTLAVCLVCLIHLKRRARHQMMERDASGSSDPVISPRGVEVRKYKRLFRTIVLECCVSLVVYLPYFGYLALTCTQCPLGNYAYRDAAVMYFIPPFLARAAFSSGVQGVRALHVHGVVSKSSADVPLWTLIRACRRHVKHSKRRNLGDLPNTISYITPQSNRCHQHRHQQQIEDDHSIHRNNNNHRHHHYHTYHHHHRHSPRTSVRSKAATGQGRVTLRQGELTLHRCVSETDLTELTAMSDGDSPTRLGAVLKRLDGGIATLLRPITDTDEADSPVPGASIDLEQGVTALDDTDSDTSTSRTISDSTRKGSDPNQATHGFDNPSFETDQETTSTLDTSLLQSVTVNESSSQLGIENPAFDHEQDRKKSENPIIIATKQSPAFDISRTPYSMSNKNIVIYKC